MQTRYPYDKNAFLNSLDQLPQKDRFDFIQRNTANMRAMCKHRDLRYHMPFASVLKKLDYEKSGLVAASNRDLITHENIADVLGELHSDSRNQFAQEQEEFWHNLYLRQQNKRDEVEYESSYESSESSSDSSATSKRERDAVVVNERPPKKTMTAANQGMFSQPRGNSRQAQQTRLLAEANEFLNKPSHR